MTLGLLEFSEEVLIRFRRLIVVGDIHGDIEALTALLSISDKNQDGVLFLGDYADRGSYGTEVLKTLSDLRKKNPRNVFLLKGNHEDYDEKGDPRFHPCTLRLEAERKGLNWQNYFQNDVKPFINEMWLAAIVPGHTLFVHGGISSKITSRADLANPTPEIEQDILWSDPFSGRGEKLNSTRGGVGVEFGSDITKRVIKQLGIKRIFRSHEPKKALRKPNYMHNRRVVTISSTSVYGGHPFAISLNPSNLSTFRVVYLSKTSYSKLD